MIAFPLLRPSARVRGAWGRPLQRGVPTRVPVQWAAAQGPGRCGCYSVRPLRPLRLCGELILLALALAGCRGGPQPPPSGLRPDPGYQRISPAGIHFSVDLPEGWSAGGGSPPSAIVLAKPAEKWHLWLAERAAGEKESAAQAAEAQQDSLLKDLAGGPARVIASEDQKTGWLPGRLIQAETRGGEGLVVLWLGAYRKRLYALGATGPVSSQLEMRETLDHAIATLRPR